MKALVIGKGGREHALAWKLAQSDHITQVYCAPGNAGTHREPKVENIQIDVMDFEALTSFVKNNHIDFTVVGPEAPLVGGIVDHFRNHGLAIWGPTKAAAQLEGSKIFAKAFMQKHNIPTAKAAFHDDQATAKAFLATCDFPVVIKADGLAEGKGVSICQDKAEAEHIIDDFLTHQRFGAASQKILIEEFLDGVEISFMILANDQQFCALASSQDHKARDNGDVGPNTGGMGAYSPAPMLTPALDQQIIENIVQPTLAGMHADGTPYTGFLYFGLMISPSGQAKVLEYNCRMGDPETQPILFRLKTDFAELIQSAIAGSLETMHLEFDERVALGVVLAESGYPAHYQTGSIIPNLKELPASKQCKVFHAGTQVQDGNIITKGGRVLCATALANTFQAAQHAAYALTQKVAWDSAYYRTDIGHKALVYDAQTTDPESTDSEIT